VSPSTIAQYASRALIHLADPALRSIVLACLVALLLAAFRVRQVTIQLAVWTALLYAALAMPLLAWLAPAIPVHVRVPAKQISAATAMLSAGRVGGVDKARPVKRKERTGRPQGPGDTNLGSRAESAGVNTVIGRRFASRTSPVARSLPQTERQDDAPGRSPRLERGLGHEPELALARLPHLVPPGLLLLVYSLGLMFLLGRLAVGFLLSRRLRRSSTRVDDPRALRWLDLHAVDMGPKRAPALAESAAISVPVTLGVFHPVIVIPSGWREWPSAKLAAVIAHEVSHARRNDPRTRALALSYRCFFWFSPLGWWLERRLANLAEQASDQAAICAGAEPVYYAEVLMSFFDVSMRQGRVNWQGVSMAHGLRARNRIEKVLATGAALPAAIKTPVLALLTLCALPMVYLTAATRPALVGNVTSATSEPPSQTAAHLQLPEAPPAPAAPAYPHATPLASPTPVAPRGPSPVEAGLGAQPGPTPAAPSPPSAPPAPTALAGFSTSPETSSRPVPSAEPYSNRDSQSSGVSATNTEEDDWLLSYVNPDDGTDATLTYRFGTQGEEALRKKLGGTFIWFVHNGNFYAIRDAGTVKDAYELFLPHELIKNQEALRKQQKEIREQQEALSNRQGQARVELPSDLEARLKKVEEEIRDLGLSATREDLGRLQSKLGDIQDYIGQLQGIVGEQQRDLGSRQSALAAQQGELARQQRELDEQQDRARQEGFRAIQEILKQALKSGLAQRAPG